MNKSAKIEKLARYFLGAEFRANNMSESYMYISKPISTLHTFINAQRIQNVFSLLLSTRCSSQKKSYISLFEVKRETSVHQLRSPGKLHNLRSFPGSSVQKT